MTVGKLESSKSIFDTMMDIRIIIIFLFFSVSLFVNVAAISTITASTDNTPITNGKYPLEAPPNLNVFSVNIVQTKDIHVQFKLGLTIKSGRFNKIEIKNSHALFYHDKVVIKPINDLNVNCKSRDTTVISSGNVNTQPETKRTCNYTHTLLRSAIVLEFINSVKSVSGKKLCESLCGLLYENTPHGIVHKAIFLKKMKTALFEKLHKLTTGEMFVIIIKENYSTGSFNGGDIFLIPKVSRRENTNSDGSITYWKGEGGVKSGKTHNNNEWDDVTALHGGDCPVCASNLIKSIKSFMK